MNINRARRPFPNPKYCIIFRFFGYNCSSSKCPNLSSRSLNLVMAQESKLAAQQQKQQQKQHNYFGQFQTNHFNCLPLQCCSICVGNPCIGGIAAIWNLFDQSSFGISSSCIAKQQLCTSNPFESFPKLPSYNVFSLHPKESMFSFHVEMSKSCLSKI